MDNTIYVTLEQGTTQWNARILEPNKPPVYFVPNGLAAPFLSKATICAAIVAKYGQGVVFVSETLFNRAVKEAEGRVLTLPDDWPESCFQLGQNVYVVSSNGGIYDEITGVFRDELWEDGAPAVYRLMYRVLHHWYTADELSVDPPADQVQSDEMFLPEALDLP